MLKYTHVFNSNVDNPYHVHIIESDTTSVAINLNGNLVGYFRPTVGTTYTYPKYVDIPSIVDLMAVGSRQVYDNKTNAAFFKDSTVKYIKNGAGDFLVLNTISGDYYWSSTDRTRFFFNPEYFSSNILWNFTIGYTPSGKVVNDIWDDATAKDLFLSQIYETTETWVGEKTIADVDPIAVLPFDIGTTGVMKTLGVDTFIEELQDLQNGDVININNGVETLDVTVANCTTDATYEAVNTTTRPLIHVPIDILNPNKKYVYTKALDIDTQEDIVLDLYGNTIEFSIARTS